MKQYSFLILFSLLSLAGWSSAAAPTDSALNPFVDAQSVFLKPHLPPSDPSMKVRFNKAIDSGKAAKLANYSLRQTSPELGAGTPGGTLEDLDGDGDLDMVLAIEDQIVAYKNEGTRSAPRYSGPPVVLATVGFYEGLVTVEEKSWDKNVTFGDLDNDGDRDMVCSEGFDGQVTCFFRQNGSPSWPVFGPQKRMLQDYGTVKTLIAVSTDVGSGGIDVSIASVAIEDLDGDGRVDLVVGDPDSMWSQPRNIQVYRGTPDVDASGSPIFKRPAALKAGGAPIMLEWTSMGATCPLFHDLDGDGDRDMIVSLSDGEIWIFKANGRDTNLGSDNIGFPIFGPGERLKDINAVEIDLGSVSALSLCDYSGDGDMDLVMVSTGASQLEQNRLRLLENLGGGGLRFSGLPLPIGVGGLEVELRTSYSSKSAYFDFDGDGHVDVLYAGGGYGLAVSYNLDTGNTPHPRFSVPAILSLPTGAVSLLAEGVPDIVDFDGDGILDVNVDGILVGTQSDLVFMKYTGSAPDGSPGFGSPVSILPSGFPTLHFIHPTVGDLNGDGKLDVVLGSGTMYSGESRNLQVLINSAAGQFQLAAPVTLTVGSSTAQTSMFPELVDFDGDGDCDLLVADRSFSFNRRAIAEGTIRFLQNAGGPVSGWVDQGLIQHAASDPVSVSGDASVRVIDFNGDGKLDLLVSAASSSVAPFLGAGSGLGISVSPASPKLKAVATLPSSVTLSEGGKTLELAFPMTVHAGNYIDLNELFVGGNLCAILGQEIKPDTTLVDSDHDGLPDDWEIQHFGSIGAYNGNDDPDGDGFTNKEEFDLGLDPNVDESTGPSGKHAGYTYDLTGRLTGVTGPVAPAVFTPDEEGNILNAH